MAAAKSAAQRQKEFKAAKVAKGMREVHNIWAHKEDHEEIKAYAEMVTKRRTSLDGKSLTFNEKMWAPVREWLAVGGEPPEWAKKDDGLFLAFDKMSISVSNCVFTQKFYYKENLVFTKTVNLIGSEFQEFGFDKPAWLSLSFC